MTPRRSCKPPGRRTAIWWKAKPPATTSSRAGGGSRFSARRLAARWRSVVFLVSEVAAEPQALDPGPALALDDDARLRLAMLGYGVGKRLRVSHQPDLRALRCAHDEAGQRVEQVGMQARLRFVQRDEGG